MITRDHKRSSRKKSEGRRVEAGPRWTRRIRGADCARRPAGGKGWRRGQSKGYSRSRKQLSRLMPATGDELFTHLSNQ